MPTTANRQPEAEGCTLTEIVRVQKRFLRSVSLQHDFYSDDPLDGYVLTASALTSLQRISLGVRDNYARATSLTGPYGSGKSAFALYASKVLATPNMGAVLLRDYARQQEPALRDALFAEDTEGFWPILLTGAREPISRGMWRGLLNALDRIPEPAAQAVKKKLVKELGAFSEEAIPSAREIVALYAAAAAHARKKSAHCRGLFVVVDELGKYLEYAAQQPGQGDMQVLQEMAEFAARSGDNAVLFVTILHQAFEDYAQPLSAQQRKEWQKVQGRFADIPFGDSPDETIRLVTHVIRLQDDPRYGSRLDRLTLENMEWCRKLDLLPANNSASEFQKTLRQTYPLHPLTLFVAPYVFRRFAQNERSLFSYLSSEEPFGFQEFLRTHELTKEYTPALRIDHLYDYIVASLGSTLYSHMTAKLWSETEESLYRLRDHDPVQSRLIKTIGLLHILGEQTGILPSREMLVFALSDQETSRAQIEEGIEKLSEATLITYRQFKGAYRPYEGSDIDIDARVREARSRYSMAADGVRLAGTLGVTQPLVARRHSYEKGVLRFFDVVYCRPATVAAELNSVSERGHGRLILCLAANETEFQHAENRIQSLSMDRTDIIVGLNIENDILHEAAVATESLLYVRDNTPELREDRVAAREVRERLQEAIAVFQAQWEDLLRPQNSKENGGRWYYHGQQTHLSSFRQLQELVSHACDETYPATPRLLNELINRRQISSTAAAARRDLIEAMLQNRGTAQLGIQGYPPQASMYRSVLENTGIHRASDDGHFGFFPPDRDKDEALAHVWSEIEGFLFGGSLEPKALIDLNAFLIARPFGLTEGVIPVLLCAVLLNHEAEVAVYEDGKFVTDLTPATFERMIKRPSDFYLQGCRIAGERQSVIDRFARGILRSDEESTLANVVRALYREYNRLPEYTVKTRRLEDRALALRDLLKAGKEPQQLLFVDLPLLLDADPFVAHDADPANSDYFFQQWNGTMSRVVGAYDELLQRLESFMCSSFGVNDWQELRARAAFVAAHASEVRLKSFVLRASDDSYERRAWLESVSAGIVGRPPANWSDVEEERFRNLLPPIVSAFRNSELVGFEKDRRSVPDEEIGIRLAVTQESGHEDARVALIRREDVEQVDELSGQVLQVVRTMLIRCTSDDMRMAVVSKVVQEMLRGGNDG